MNYLAEIQQLDFLIQQAFCSHDSNVLVVASRHGHSQVVSHLLGRLEAWQAPWLQKAYLAVIEGAALGGQQDLFQWALSRVDFSKLPSDYLMLVLGRRSYFLVSLMLEALDRQLETYKLVKMAKGALQSGEINDDNFFFLLRLYKQGVLGQKADYFFHYNTNRTRLEQMFKLETQQHQILKPLSKLLEQWGSWYERGVEVEPEVTRVIWNYLQGVPESLQAAWAENGLLKVALAYGHTDIVTACRMRYPRLTLEGVADSFFYLPANAATYKLYQSCLPLRREADGLLRQLVSWARDPQAQASELEPLLDQAGSQTRVSLLFWASTLAYGNTLPKKLLWEPLVLVYNGLTSAQLLQRSRELLAKVEPKVLALALGDAAQPSTETVYHQWPYMEAYKVRLRLGGSTLKTLPEDFNRKMVNYIPESCFRELAFCGDFDGIYKLVPLLEPHQKQHALEGISKLLRVYSSSIVETIPSNLRTL